MLIDKHFRRKGVATMATNNIDARFFSQDAVVCVLRNLIPTSRETRREVGELKRLLQFNFHNVITICMHVNHVEVYSGVVEAVGAWWLGVLALHQPSWRERRLLVNPAPEEALDYYLDHVVAQA